MTSKIAIYIHDQDVDQEVIKTLRTTNGWIFKPEIAQMITINDFRTLIEGQQNLTGSAAACAVFVFQKTT